jgi:minor extracellular serine protease Vpr
MKQLIITIILALVAGPVFAQKAKLSPQTRIYLLQMKMTGRAATLPGYVYKIGANNETYISALIKAGAVQESALSAIGVKVGTKAGDIWTAQVPLNAIDAFINTEGISYIQFDEPVFATMDTARITTRVDSGHAGINLPMPYTGKDVVVGVIDAGFDYTHVSLFDTTGNNFRVKKIWEQKRVGIPPSQFFYGNELVTPTSMFNAKTDANGFSHGAHVAGIAAGSGFGSDNTHSRFRGMAYESDLVLVGINPDSYAWTSTGLSDIIDAISYIFSYAAINGKPAVANLSWGCCIGPHDGTSLFSQACDNLTGPGKIFVCSAGNNGQNLIHFNKAFSGNDTLIKTVLSMPVIDGEKRAWVDAWADTGEAFCMEASLYNGSTFVTTTASFCSGDSAFGTYELKMAGLNGDTCYINLTTDSATFNNKPRILLDILNLTGESVVLTLRSSNADLHMWTGYVKNKRGYYGAFQSHFAIQPSQAGNATTTISDISATNSAIAVGAYTSKNLFQNILGNTIDYTSYAAKGALAPFSSLGPTTDGRTKPDITGPGLVLGSAVSSYDTTYSLTTGSGYPSVVTSYYKQQNNRTYQYAMLMGTSMSAPAASGIMALLLQIKPTITPDEMKTLLKETAIIDNYTGSIPSSGSNFWGHGKINAYGAVQKLLAEVLGIETIETNGVLLPCLLYPNPNKGSYNLAYSSPRDETVHVEVFNISGSTIMNRDWKVSKGENTLAIDLREMSAGVYFTKLSTREGSTVIKLVIE